MARLPEESCGWAGGQHLTFRESEVIEGAIGYVQAANSVALPLHDALIVPVSGVEAARRGLEGAFSVLIGVQPRINVKDTSSK
jgi:hypothetical protein